MKIYFQEKSDERDERRLFGTKQFRIIFNWNDFQQLIIKLINYFNEQNIVQEFW